MSPKRHDSSDKATVLKDLQRIPGLDRGWLGIWWSWGLGRVEDLLGCKPERLYEELCALRGRYEDPCVLYTFRCAVYYASEAKHEPEKLKWWNWMDGDDAAKAKTVSRGKAAAEEGRKNSVTRRVRR